MDDITTVDAIKALEYMKHNVHAYSCYDMALNAAIAALEKARWIPCSERLPEKHREVLVCCYGSDILVINDGETMLDAIQRSRKENVTVTLGYIDSDGWCGTDGWPMMVTPACWMSLPEPPEVRKE